MIVLSFYSNIIIIMGIETEIRKLCRDVCTPNAWSIQSKIKGGDQVGVVAIEELLIRLMGWTHCYSKWMEDKYNDLSGDEFFNLVWEPVQEFLMKEENRAYVLGVDDKVNVKKKNLKTRTHSERQHRKNASIAARNKKYAAKADAESKLTQQKVEAKVDISKNPYEPGFTINDEGLVWPDAAAGALTTPLRFSVSRLMESDRTVIWAYLLEKIKKKHIPHNKMVIFDFKADGPWLFTTDSHHRHAPELAHDTGETDLSVLYWCWYFYRFQVRLITTDTDTIPILLSYLYHVGEHYWNPRLEWQYLNQERNALERFGPKKAPNYYVDLLMMYREIPSATRLNIQHFILACILSGTDHYDRQIITDGFKWPVVFEAVRLVGKPLVDILFQHDEEREDDVDMTISKLILALQRFRVVCQFILNRRVNAVPVITKLSEVYVTYDKGITDADVLKGLASFDYLKDRVELGLPSPSAFEQAAKELMQNIQYWYESWTQWQVQRKVRTAQKRNYITVKKRPPPLISLSPSEADTLIASLPPITSYSSNLPFIFFQRKERKKDNNEQQQQSAPISSVKNTLQHTKTKAAHPHTSLAAATSARSSGGYTFTTASSISRTTKREHHEILTVLDDDDEEEEKEKEEPSKKKRRRRTEQEEEEEFKLVEED
jgi:hypothetical protein